MGKKFCFFFFFFCCFFFFFFHPEVSPGGGGGVPTRCDHQKNEAQAANGSEREGPSRRARRRRVANLMWSLEEGGEDDGAQ